MTKALAEERTETLGRRVYAALERGETDARLLDARDFKRATWERARAALFELLRRVEEEGERST